MQARFDTEQVTAEGASHEFTRVSDSGGEAVFNFCPDCGATVFYTTDASPGVVAVPVGAFADPSFPAPTRSVWESDGIRGWGFPTASNTWRSRRRGAGRAPLFAIRSLS